jgi:hypothetical protein
LAADATEHIGRVGDIERGRDEAERGMQARFAESGARQVLALSLEADISLREERTLLRTDVFLRLAKCCLCCIKIGVGVQRLFNKMVQWLRVE